MRTKGRGLTDLKAYTKIPLLHAFCHISICTVFLLNFVVFDGEFHYCFIKHFI